MRLIDADELMNEYQMICSSIRCYDCQFNGEWGDKGCQLEAMINNAPTVDPVVRGNWVFNDPLRGDFQCDNCLDRSMICTRYCPSCGALMYEWDDDEVEEDEID